MPPWHTRLHVGSPSNKHTSNQRLLPFEETSHGLGSFAEDAPLHGVPIWGSQSQNPTAGSPRPPHVRSHSHPFASTLSKGHSLGAGVGLSRETCNTDKTTVLESSDSNLDTKGAAAAANQLDVAPHADRDLVNGRCATCNSLVRWPKRLDVFRCAVCLMINDLKPRPQGAIRPGFEQPKHDLNLDVPSSDVDSCSPRISIPRTSDIVSACLERYVRQMAFRNSQAFVDASLSAGIPKPPSTPFSPRSHPTTLGEELDKKMMPETRGVFNELEEYIRSCFQDMECLNSSFLLPRPDRPVRAVSESCVPIRQPPIPTDDRRTANINYPEIDEKTLLLGDFAENGIMWAGRSPQLEALQPRADKIPVVESDDSVTAKSPCIHWDDVYKWYDVILSLQHSSPAKVQEMRSRSGEAELYTGDAHQISEALKDSSLQVHQTLLKATEGVMRRPGRPLRSPSDCRFLLIVLANPLLSRSETADPSNTPLDNPIGPSSHRPMSSRQTHDPHSEELPTSPTRRKMRTSMSKHPSVLKRILGLLSNLPPECHQFLVNWISRYSEVQMFRLVDMIGSFVSHRLSRLQCKRRGTKDTTSGRLIPDMSGPGAGTSAHLHAAIGVAPKGKPQESLGSGTNYGTDWQLKAAAKVMLLFFTANNNDQLVLNEPSEPATSKKRRPRTYSAMRRRTQRHTQLIPTYAFYNSSLDYCDLISDFEIWESRRGEFCFCQYPMFLSIWAKIHVMEYDTRRQMEIKAREAFFQSIMSRKATSQYLVLKVRRECLVEDSLRNVSEVVGTGQEEIKKGLKIHFLDEEGLDSGGLRKEWFLLLVREIFDPDHGLFVYDETSNYCYFNPHSFETSDQFFLVGALLGLAIYNSTILDVALPPFAFRKLMASSPVHAGPNACSSISSYHSSVEDLAEFMPELAHGLKQLLAYDGDVEQAFALDFVVTTEAFGQVQSTLLCPKGDRRPVTNVNRREYVDLYVRYMLDTAVKRQYEPFKRGFFTVCGGNALSLFRAEEIELLVRGSDEPLDVTTIKAVAVYDGWSTGTDPTCELPVIWFWEAWVSATPRLQRKLLAFITASDRIPAVGAASLVVKVVCVGNDPTKFPIARTCFNMIGLQRYPTKEVLQAKVWKAVAEGGGFGMK